MEIVRDILKVEELKGYEKIESIIETDLYLNQTKPDIEKVLWVDGNIEILSTKIINDKILVNGLIKFKVVYKSQEEELNIYLLETNRDFKEEIEIEGINDEMAGDVKPKLEHIEYEIIDERKLSLRALISLQGKVEQVNLVDIIKDIKGGSSLQILKEKIKYNDVIGNEESYTFIKEAFEIEDEQPSIEEILKIQLMAYERDFNISQDRLIISGVIQASIIYLGGDKLNSIVKEIPFTHFIEMADIQEGFKCQINMEVIDGGYELRENLEGKIKVIDLETKVKLLAKVYKQEEKEVVIDAYSTNTVMSLQREGISIIENIKDIVNRENIYKELSSKGFKEVYAIEGKVHTIDSQYIEDKIMIENVLLLTIYYLEEVTNEISTLEEEIAFKSYVSVDELKINPITNVYTSLEELKYDLKDDFLKIEGKVKNHIFIDRERKINILSEIEETENLINKKNRPSITIYIVQKDDKLWDIAKRYNTTTEEIILSNNIISPSTLMPGEKIIIEKKIDVDF